MYYDFSVNKEKAKAKSLYTKDNKDYFFNQNINTVASVGVKPKSPKKNFIPIIDKFFNLNDEINMYNEYFTEELSKIKRFAYSFDNKDHILYDKFYEMSRILTDTYFHYINDEKENEVFLAIKDINEFVRDKIDNERKMIKYIYQIQLNFRNLQIRIRNMLNNIENNQKTKIDFFMDILNKELNAYDTEDLFVFDNDEFIRARRKIMNHLRRDEEIEYGDEKINLFFTSEEELRKEQEEKEERKKKLEIY